MKKLSKILVAYFMLMAAAGTTTTFATGTAPTDNKQAEEVKLTDAQKAELAKMHKSIMEQKKQLLQKYVDFGVLPKEKADEMVKRYEEHYKMLEENGFIYKHPGKFPGREHGHHY